MRIVSPFLGALLLLGSVAACGSDDKVLDADDTGDGDGDGKQGDGGDGDGDDDTGDGDTGNGDGDGDGDIGDGDGDGDGDGAPTTVAKDADCDLNGIWAGRQVTVSKALSAPQYASNWYYLEFAQDGENVVVKKHFDCGIEVKGTVNVKLTPETTKALTTHNVQTGRKGTLKKMGDQCVFTMERFWSIRGASEAMYRPTGEGASQDIAQAKAANPLPTKDDTEGAEDWDNDGELGVAWQVTGIVSGTRNTVQRDWTEWFSDASHAITPSADFTKDLVVRAKFNNEENVMAPADGLITQLSSADSTAAHTLTLKFLGRSKSDPRAKEVLKSNDFDTCLAIQGKLPALNKL